jgi:hypothetical protein
MVITVTSCGHVSPREKMEMTSTAINPGLQLDASHQLEMVWRQSIQSDDDQYGAQCWFTAPFRRHFAMDGLSSSRESQHSISDATATNATMPFIIF